MSLRPSSGVIIDWDKKSNVGMSLRNLFAVV
jgi:hypothetical protein